MAPDQPRPEKGEPPRGPEPSGPHPGTGPWLTDLASLTRTGQISERVVARIPWQTLGDQAGSWLDPLFHGPAPIAELQGLGERYVKLQFLGEGAAGTVFKAFDTLLQRWVALKALKEGAGHALTEARAQAQVEHPNVCRVYEVGRGFIVMQLVEGPTLATRGPGFGLRAQVACLRDIALGVHAAHQRGLLHLDLKLNNVLLQDGQDGTFTPVLGDFGMVVDRSGALPEACPLGTPPYASPEQLAGDLARIGPATDVYAIGMMAYILFAGQTPFDAPDLEGLLVAMVRGEPIPLERRAPGVPRDLARLVHQCLCKDPAQRGLDAAELAQEFDRFLLRRPLRVMGPALPYRALRCAQRNRFTTAALLAGAAVLALAVGAGLWREARTARRMDWDRHFQKRVEDARVLMDRAYRRPVHDLRPELAQVTAIGEEIRRDLAQQGRLVEGPAHLALGQLAFAGDALAAEAARHFKAAWDAGFRTEGARTWYAYALLREYREAFDKARQLGGAGLDANREALRQRFLEPARQILQGRRDTDQARLAHLVDLVELQLAPSSGPAQSRQDRFLALVVAYRRQAPQDLDALLEEIDARTVKLQYEISEEQPSRPLPELQEHYQALLAVLEEGRVHAPSHPGVLVRLASTLELGMDTPGLDPAPKRDLLARAEASMAQALQVAPDDARVHALRLGFLMREVLDEGRPPDALRTEIQRTLGLPQAIQNDAILSILVQVARGAWRGRDLLPLGMEVLASRQDWYALPNASLCVYLLSDQATRLGLDPRPVLHAAGPGFVPKSPWSLAAREAGFLIQAGRAAEFDLDRMEAAFAKEFPSGPPGVRVTLLRPFLKARTRGSAADWQDLEQAHARFPELARAQGFPMGDEWIHCCLTLAEHAPAAGQDPAPFLEAARKAMGELTATQLVARLRRDILEGQYALAAARAGRGAIPVLREGMAHLDAALACVGDRIPFSDLIRAALQLPGPGPTFATRAELGLRLARALDGPAKREAARNAHLDFERALRLCPDFRPRLDPLRQEALGLEKTR